MAFELFTRKKAHGGPPSVTVTKYGNFVVNSTALEKYFQAGQFVHMYYDADTGRVGIKPLPKRLDKSYRLNRSPKGNVATISGSAFLSFIGYDPKETTNFAATWNEEEELLEFTIKSSSSRSLRRIGR
jgi:hypothetical protein